MTPASKALEAKMGKALGVPSLHKPNRAVKGLVAHLFLADGFLFLKKFDTVKNSKSDILYDFRSKVVVDLYMSIECSLKSMVISLSKDDETPAEAYKQAR